MKDDDKTQGFRVELQVSGEEGELVRDKTGTRQGTRQSQDRHKIPLLVGQDGLSGTPCSVI